MNNWLRLWVSLIACRLRGHKWMDVGIAGEPQLGYRMMCCRCWVDHPDEDSDPESFVNYVEYRLNGGEPIT